MPYYPKNKIQTNLYSNGKSLVNASTLALYTGPYYKVSNGQMFIGQNPQSNRYPEELIDIFDFPEIDETITNTVVSTTSGETVGQYVQNLKDKPTDKQIPIPFYPKPTPQDYKKGYFTRYFAKQINNFSFIEINRQTYLNLFQNNSEYLWELYYVTEIPWQISGDVNKVYHTNENVVKLQERNKFRGLSDFLRKNYLKFHLDKEGRKVGEVKMR